MRPERRKLSKTLRTGVLISFVLLAGGTIRSLWVPPEHVIHPRSLAGVIESALAMDATALIHLGLIALMLTPFSRLVVLLVHFLHSREYPFAGITIGVLCLLIVTVVIGLF